MKYTGILVIVVILALLIGGAVGFYLLKGQDLGSVTVGNEYSATSTPFDSANTDGQIDTGWGALGSVIITSTGDLRFYLLDATSTVATNRPTARQATSSAMIGDFSTAALGNFVLDVSYVDGLMIDVYEGDTGTTTITYR